MSMMEKKFINYNRELQKKVQTELLKAEKGISNKNTKQLQFILQELKETEKEKGLILSFPRLIIDSWDYADNLGSELIKLAEMYKKLV